MTPPPELAAILAETLRLGTMAGATRRVCRVPLARTDDGTPHVAYDRGTYRYVVTERGQTLETRETRDGDELLYWILADITFGLAIAHELANRQAGADSRRLIFAHQLARLGRLNPAWRARRAGEIDRILEQHPYHDATEAEA